MKLLDVNIEIEGNQVYVGTISGNDYTDASFCYDSSYLERDGIMPISVSLPFRDEPFSAYETKNYFEGLLPEGFSRKSIANWIKSDEEDYITILKVLGRECLGAIYTGGEIKNNIDNYRLLKKSEVRALAAEGATESTKLLVQTHLSLAGASGKVGLYYDESNERWYLPVGKLPSTHIVKQSHIRLKQIVLNEQICMRTAKKLGIPVADSFIINFGEGKDEDVLFATKRYDREISNSSVNGLKLPCRLHQEDFAQALGIPSSKKYEQKKDNYLGSMFNLISKVASNPVRDKLLLWDMLVFNYLIGNTDCHIKNYSLLYNKSLRKIKIAPAYDIVCTQVYNSSKEMSLYIGEKLLINSVGISDFELAASEAGIGKKLAIIHFDEIINKFEAALKASVNELTNLGYKDADKLGMEILNNSGFKYISG